MILDINNLGRRPGSVKPRRRADGGLGLASEVIVKAPLTYHRLSHAGGTRDPDAGGGMYRVHGPQRTMAAGASPAVENG